MNVDHLASAGTDVVHDLNTFPYPFADRAFDVIEADHVLEHLADPFRAMRELSRLAAPGGTIIIRVPHFSRGFTHPEHRRGFDVTFPHYFEPTFQGGYQGVPLQLQALRLHWFAQPYLKRTVVSPTVFAAATIVGAVLSFAANLAPAFCSRCWCFLVGGFEEIEFHFRVPSG